MKLILKVILSYIKVINQKIVFVISSTEVYNMFIYLIMICHYIGYKRGI
jgi:hypothetical protein